MGRRHVAGVALVVSLALGTCGCWIRTGPEWLSLPPSDDQPVMRLGEVTVELSGTWKRHKEYAGEIKRATLDTLRGEQVTTYFSSDLSNLVLDLHVVVDHEDDEPRMAALAGWSILSLGLIPLNYHAEWDAKCEFRVKLPDGTLVGKYPVEVTGSYDIWAFPPTMFTLLGAGIIGPSSGRKVMRRVCNNVAAKATDLFRTNYAHFAQLKETGTRVARAAPLRVPIGGRTYWVRGRIAYDMAGARTVGRRRYLLEVHRAPPTPSAEPWRELTLGTRPGTVRADAPWRWHDPKQVLLYARGRLWYPVCRVEGTGDTLVSAEFQERPLPADELFAAGLLDRLPPEDRNPLLLSWKNSALGTALRRASARELRQTADRIERLIVLTNEAAEKEKDAAQKLTVKQRPGAERHVQAARRLRTRVEILKAVVKAVKAEAARRAP